MAVVIDGTAGITSGPISGTIGSFSGDMLLGSSVLATPAGSAPSYTCRAWVNFNGTGTVAIQASGNVSSITDNGTGDYTVNFTTAMPDAKYSMACSAVGLVGYQVQFGATPKANTAFSTTSVGVVTGNTSSAAFSDSATISVALFR
jgi:hypothetical protein